MILADTSVWVEHLRRGLPELARRLDAAEVLVHPLVIGELACGTLRWRDRFIANLQLLPAVPRATDDEALVFLEKRGLHGRGLGIVDVHLLASVALSGYVRLWSLDKRLQAAADSLR